MRKLLIIDTHPYGTLTDVAKWCDNMPKDIKVKVVCLKNIEDKPTLPQNVKLLETPFVSSYNIRGALFVLSAIITIIFHKGPILVEYFKGCSIFKKLMPWRRMLLDVRTLAVWGNMDVNGQKIRDKYDNGVRNAAKCYDALFVISEGMKDKIGNVGKPVYMLPLGADVISTKEKKYAPIRLLYVGTLMNRNLEKTILGLSQFVNKFPADDISYDIIGGNTDEVEKFREYAKALKCDKYIMLHGRIAHCELKPYFDKCNIGVSFVPITPSYNIQPVTKTFEYANSGLYVIGTATVENKKVINSDCGILISDTHEDFCSALEFIREQASTIEENKVRQSLSRHNWANIVQNCLLPIILNIRIKHSK